MAGIVLLASACSRHSDVAKPESKPAITPTISQQTAKKNADSCWSFVQGFYDWYLPKTNWDRLQKLPGPASDLALKYKPDAFSPRLFKALKNDSDAQRKFDELVSIDFDPFLASQDPDERYEVRNVTHRGETCRAEVYGIGDSEARSGPDVVPELVAYQASWRFVNFHYPRLGNSDLLTTLAEFAKDREKNQK